jgi:hypothetical protein
VTVRGLLTAWLIAAAVYFAGGVLAGTVNSTRTATPLNASTGRAACNGATEVTVTTTQVTATSNIFLTGNVTGGTPLGVAYVSARSAGVSFGFKCAATDTSTVAWLMVQP